MIQQDKEVEYRELGQGAVEVEYQAEGGMAYPAEKK